MLENSAPADLAVRLAQLCAVHHCRGGPVVQALLHRYNKDGSTWVLRARCIVLRALWHCISKESVHKMCITLVDDLLESRTGIKTLFLADAAHVGHFLVTCAENHPRHEAVWGAWLSFVLNEKNLANSQTFSSLSFLLEVVSLSSASCIVNMEIHKLNPLFLACLNLLRIFVSEEKLLPTLGQGSR